MAPLSFVKKPKIYQNLVKKILFFLPNLLLFGRNFWTRNTRKQITAQNIGSCAWGPEPDDCLKGLNLPNDIAHDVTHKERENKKFQIFKKSKLMDKPHLLRVRTAL